MQNVQENKFSRYGIFVFYDRDGIVDDYVLYLLEDICENLDGLTIICNGKLLPEGREKFEKYSNNIICRENKGYDIVAFKKAILEFDGIQKLSGYDEIVLFNDTFYGPFYPFKIIFDSMEKRNVDIWGISNHNEAPDNTASSVYGYLPKFIESYFTCFRNKVVKSREFMEYWSNISDAITYEDAIHKHETIMAEKFKNMGFKWETFIDNTDLFVKREYNIAYNIFDPEMMIKKRKLPILRRKAFVWPFDNIINFTNGENLAKALKYIEKNTDYDTNLIWKNLLRLYDVADLKQSLHLNYILPSNYHLGEEKFEKAVVIAHLYYEDLFDDCLQYLSNVPESIDIYITTSNEEKKLIILDKCKKLNIKIAEVRVVGNRGRDLAALLVGCNDLCYKYEYMCFVHDKKTLGNSGPSTIGSSFMKLLFENTLCSSDYILNILASFKNDKRLGILAPPEPSHNVYATSTGCEWTVNYENTKKLAEKLGLNCNLSEDKPPFVLGTAFWCRTKAILPLFDYKFKYEDFPEEPLPIDGTISHSLERIFQYAAQSEGYYSGWAFNQEYASLDISNIRYMLSRIFSVQQKKYNYLGTCFEAFINKLANEPYFDYKEGITDPIQRLRHGSVYFDSGYGFSEDKKFDVYYKPDKEGNFEINLNNILADDVVGIRFDPDERKNTVVKIDEMSYKGISLMNYRTNADNIYNFFSTTDPYFLASVSKDVVNNFMVKGTIVDVPRDLQVYFNSTHKSLKYYISKVKERISEKHPKIYKILKMPFKIIRR